MLEFAEDRLLLVLVLALLLLDELGAIWHMRPLIDMAINLANRFPVDIRYRYMIGIPTSR